MENLSINIYDEENLEAVTIFERAQLGSIVLTRSGNNSKTDKIIGSDLQFNMLVNDRSDGKFFDLYASDEKRFRVRMLDEDTGAIVFEGHLLPEQHEEPWKGGPFFVNFVATCGLGTLKNVYLPPEFYYQEKSVIQLFCACLKLTLVDLPVRFSFALSNIAVGWNSLKLSPSRWLDNDGEKLDAYSILEKLCSFGLCVFQKKGYWVVMGWNKRNFITRDFQVYNTDGVFQSNESFIQRVESYKFRQHPMIRTIAPLKAIVATYKPVNSQIDTRAVKNPKDYVYNGTPLTITSDQWVHSNSIFRAKWNTSNGRVYIDTWDANIDLNRFIVLRDEVLLQAGRKMQMNIEMSSDYDGLKTQASVDQLIADGDWDKIVSYELFYRDPATGAETILYSNETGGSPTDIRYQLPFNKDRKASLSIDFIAPITGYYNLKIFRLVGNPVLLQTDQIYFDKIELLDIDYKEEQIAENTIPERYSQVEEIELDFHDRLGDDPGLIRLGTELEEPGDLIESISADVMATYEVDGVPYVELNMSNILAVANNLKSVYLGSLRIDGIQVIYNFEGTSAMVFTYDQEALGQTIVSTDTLTIQRRKKTAITGQTLPWQQWTDDVYKVTYTGFVDTLLAMYRSLFTKPHIKLEGQAFGYPDIDDVITFRYREDKLFYPLFVSWNLTQGFSQLILSENFYGESLSVSLPPTVNAGPDITLPVGQTTAALNASASDPDGTIESVLWEVISGSGVIFSDPTILNPTLSGLTGDSYEIRVTVTDNVGLTASDTIRISRSRDFVIVEEVLINESTDTEFETTEKRSYRLTINPELEAETVRFTIKVLGVLKTPNNIAGSRPSLVASIVRTNLDEVGTFGGNTVTTVGVWSSDVNTTVTVLLNRRQSIDLYGFVKSYFTNYNPDFIGKITAEISFTVTAEIAFGGSGVISNQPLNYYQKSVK